MRFHIFSVMILILLFSFSFFYLITHSRKNKFKTKAINYLQSCGFTVEFEQGNYNIITRIDSNGARITPGAISAFKVLENVRELVIANCDTRDVELYDTIGKLNGLEVLDLQGSSVDDRLFSRLSNLHNLTYINVLDTKLTSVSFNKLCREAKNLHGLYIGFINDDSVFETLPRFNKLKWLKLSCAHLKTSHIEYISGCSELEYLDIYCDESDEGSLVFLERLSNLNVLVLAGRGFTENSRQYTRGIRSLRSFKIE